MKHHGECARCAELAAQVAELQQTFDLRWEADMRAVKRWRAAHPGNELVLPDRANMVVWLLEQHDARAQRALPPPKYYDRRPGAGPDHVQDHMAAVRGDPPLIEDPALTSTERCRHCDEVVEPGHDCSAPSTERAKETP